MEIIMKELVGGRCPPAPPAPAFGIWGPCPIYLSLGYANLVYRFFMRGRVPLKLPLGRVTFLLWRTG